MSFKLKCTYRICNTFDSIFNDGLSKYTEFGTLKDYQSGMAEIIKNDKNRPLIVYTRDTMIALNRNESSNIEVEEVKG